MLEWPSDRLTVQVLDDSTDVVLRVCSKPLISPLFNPMFKVAIAMMYHFVCVTLNRR